MSEFRSEGPSFTSEQFAAFKVSTETLQALGRLVNPVIEAAAKLGPTKTGSYPIEKGIADLGVGNYEGYLPQGDSSIYLHALYYAGAAEDEDMPVQPMSEYGYLDLPDSYQGLLVKKYGEVHLRPDKDSPEEIGIVFWRVDDEESILKGGVVLVQEERQKFAWQEELTQFDKDMLLKMLANDPNVTDVKMSEFKNHLDSVELAEICKYVAFGERHILGTSEAEELSGLLAGFLHNQENLAR